MKRVALLVCLLFLTAPLGAEPSEAQVVLLGESHTSTRDHQGQLEALQLLSQLDDKPLLVCLEMFNETGSGTLESFRKRSSFQDLEPEVWSEQWGHPYELYRPILRWCHQNRVPLAYLRPDPAFTKRVKNGGAVEALEELGEFFLGPAGYREYLTEIANNHMPDGESMPKEAVNSFFLVQCFWDEFMSKRIMDLTEQFPDHRIVVLVGSGHLQPNFGIPLRLQRRAGDLKFVTVGFDPEETDWKPELLLLPGSHEFLSQ